MLHPARHLIRGVAMRALTLSALVLTLAFAPSAHPNLGLPSAASSVNPRTAPTAQAVVSPFTVRITGKRAVGHALRASLSSSPAPGSTVRYVWLRNGKRVVGTSSRHVVLLTDTGAPLTVRVTVSQAGYVSRTATGGAGTIARPHVHRVSAKALAAGHAPSGTRAWSTASTKSRWFQITNANGDSRMFRLKGARLIAFLHTGGVRAHGLPIRTKCGLPGHGCLTHYTHGTIYTAPHGVRGITTVRGSRGDMLAVAYSQIGYHERLGYYALHNTKYNEFNHSAMAWCSFVQSWAAYYSGHPKVAPRHPRFTKFRAHLRATGTHLRLPKVGAFALLTYSEDYSHCGLIVKTSKDRRSFEIIEGNWGGKVGTRWLTVGGANSPQQFWFPRGY